MSEVSRSNTNATNVSVASSGMDKGKKKESPRPVMIVIVLFLIVPSGITGYLSYLEGSACAVGRDNCKNECYESYVNADRQFQSQMKGEMECYDNCDADLVRCSAVSTNLVFGALFLAGGILVAFCINVVIPHIIGYDESDDKIVYDIRAAYIEPFPTEEQQRKKEKNRFRFFWQDKFQPPDIVEVVCGECSHKSFLDAKWLKAKKGGMDSALCVRCRTIIAGVA